MVQLVIDRAQAEGLPVTLESTERGSARICGYTKSSLTLFDAVGLPLYRSMGFKDFAQVLVAEQDETVKVRAGSCVAQCDHADYVLRSSGLWCTDERSRSCETLASFLPPRFSLVLAVTGGITHAETLHIAQLSAPDRLKRSWMPYSRMLRRSSLEAALTASRFHVPTACLGVCEATFSRPVRSS